MSLNRYAYAGANPVNFVDPSGMIYETPYAFAGCSALSQTHSCECCLDPINRALCESIPFYSGCSCSALDSALADLLEIGVSVAQAPFFLMGLPVEADYPDDCRGLSAENCMMNHIRFFPNTPTAIALHYNLTPIPKVVRFGIFVAPDRLLQEINYHEDGTPLDVKQFYENAYGSNCMIMFGQEWGFDFVGNLLFGYIGAHAGFSEDFLLVGAGLAQMASDYSQHDSPLHSSANPFEDYGDAPADQIAARIGFALYQRCGSDCSRTDVESVLGEWRTQYVIAEYNSPTSACRPRIFGG